MISGDPSILKAGSGAHDRLQLQTARVSYLEPHVWGRGGDSAFAILRAARQGSFNVVTAQDPFFRGCIAWFAARVSHARLNLQVHTDLSAHSVWRQMLSNFLLRRADSIRVVSQKIKEQVLNMGVHAPVTVLPVFVDLARFKNITHRPHPYFQKTIVWAGRFEAEKDPLYALEILKEVRKRGIDTGLVMLGIGSMEQILRRQAEGLPVEFPGWQDPIGYLAQADVVVSTSLHESWGASIVEALVAGVPVVAPDVGIAKEAGAVVVAREKIAETVAEILRRGGRGELKIHLLNKNEWAKVWKESL